MCTRFLAGLSACLLAAPSSASSARRPMLPHRTDRRPVSWSARSTAPGATAAATTRPRLHRGRVPTGGTATVTLTRLALQYHERHGHGQLRRGSAAPRPSCRRARAGPVHPRPGVHRLSARRGDRLQLCRLPWRQPARSRSPTAPRRSPATAPCRVPPTAPKRASSILSDTATPPTSRGWACAGCDLHDRDKARRRGAADTDDNSLDFAQAAKALPRRVAARPDLRRRPRPRSSCPRPRPAGASEVPTGSNVGVEFSEPETAPAARSRSVARSTGTVDFTVTSAPEPTTDVRARPGRGGSER